MQNDYVWSKITEVLKGLKQIAVGAGKVREIPPTKDICQHLETFQLSQLEDGCYWHLVARS